MARIVIASYVVRMPVGGYQSWMLRWLLGFQQLGHDVWFVEKSGWPKSCIDPLTWKASNDCTYGMTAWNSLLARFGLQDRWCYVDAAGGYHGISRAGIEAVFNSADLFVDHMRGSEWVEEAAAAGMRVMVDGEPAHTQMEMELEAAAGTPSMAYDHYYTVGLNIGRPSCSAPTAGRDWRPIVNPIVEGLWPHSPPSADAPFTTIMSWRAFKPLKYRDVMYGSKNLEFPKILNLPSLTSAPLELAVSGKAPTESLRNAGWRLRDSVEVTLTYDAWLAYLLESRGEVGIAKQYFVATNSGWFSERSAAYLACGRPVIAQDTGFSEHLPCGRGLFAFRTAEEAAAAIDAVESDYERHSGWARELAREHFASDRVLARFVRELGLS